MVGFPREVFRLQRAQQRDPAPVHALQQGKRNLNRSQGVVRQVGPSLLIIRLDGRSLFRECQLATDISVQVAVGNVVDKLANGPAAVTVWHIQLAVGKTEDGFRNTLRQGADHLDMAGSDFGRWVGVRGKAANGIPRIHKYPRRSRIKVLRKPKNSMPGDGRWMKKKKDLGRSGAKKKHLDAGDLCRYLIASTIDGSLNCTSGIGRPQNTQKI